jgi:hypothetical protein
VDAEVQLGVDGMPTFTVVGLPRQGGGESRARVRAPLIAIGLALPSSDPARFLRRSLATVRAMAAAPSFQASGGAGAGVSTPPSASGMASTQT